LLQYELPKKLIPGTQFFIDLLFSV